MLHVLLIGAGTMGGAHARAYMTMDNCKLVGVVDIRKEHAAEFASLYKTRTFDTLEEALQSGEQIDVIDVCLPTHLHKEFVLKAADAGKHVICEKPLAGNLADAREMIDYCEQKQVKLFVGHVLRFFPEYAQAKQLVDTDAVGPINVASMSRTGAFPRGWNNWFANFEWSGGLILDMIIHDFDFLRWCFGDVVRVYAKGLWGSEYPEQDYALVTLRFQNGTIAHVEGSWAHDQFKMKFELAGNKGIIDHNSSIDKPLVAFERKATTGKAGVAVPESPLKETPYARELTHFFECIEQNIEPIVTAEDAYRAVEIALAAIESIQTGKVITLATAESQ